MTRAAAADDVYKHIVSVNSDILKIVSQSGVASLANVANIFEMILLRQM